MHLSSWLCSGCILFALVLYSRAEDLAWMIKNETTTQRNTYIEELMVTPRTQQEQEAYFRQYGYVATAAGDLTNPSPADYEEAIRLFQNEAGLQETGTMTEETVQWMNYRRCGNTVTVNTLSNRRKRFAFLGQRWSGRQPTYRISRYTPDLPRGEVDRIISDALNIWSQVTPLSFSRPTGRNVDLDIQFSPRSHGDENFDGRGGTLAHAFSPDSGLGGDVHFDEDETWTDRQRQGVNLLQVAVHEIGHALGLAHSNIQSAVMAAFYRGYIPIFTLDPDDIAGIQSLYGRLNPPPTQPTQRPTQRPTWTPTQRPTTRTPFTPFPTDAPRPTNRPIPENCRGQFDAIAAVKLGGNREFTFGFKDSNMYIIHSSDQGPPQVQNVQQTFGNHIYLVDAAIAQVRSYSSANLFLFQGGNIYHYTVSVGYDGRSSQVARGSTLQISQALQGLPDNIDAITSFRGNIYAFKGSEYYRIDGNRVGTNYPRPLSVWNLPINHVNSVVTWLNGRTYFFEGDQYYRFHAYQLRVDNGYPRPIGKNWLQCESANLEASTDLPWEQMESGQGSGYTDVKTAIQEEQEGTVGAAGATGVSSLLMLISTMVSVILLSC